MIEYAAFCNCGWWDKAPTEKELWRSTSEHRRTCRKHMDRYCIGDDTDPDDTDPGGKLLRSSR